MRFPRVRRLTRATLCALAILFGASVGNAQTIVFLVRHGEKAAQPAADPPLTTEGEARAAALADVLANAGIGAIISTPVLRTTSTAKPLATKLGLTVETAPLPQSGAEGIAKHAQAVADMVHKHAGHAVLVVGHSNTIPAIATALGAPKLADLCDGDYDQLLIVEIPTSGPARFVRSRYGAPAADAKCALTMGR